MSRTHALTRFDEDTREHDGVQGCVQDLVDIVLAGRKDEKDDDAGVFVLAVAELRHITDLLLRRNVILAC